MLIAGHFDAQKIRNLGMAALLTAVMVFAGLLFVYCVVEPVKNNDFLYYNDPSGLHVSDFVLFFVSGKMVLAGERLHAYDPEVQRHFIDEVIYPNKLQKVFFLQYPPITFAVMAPFALLAVKFSYLAWVIFLTLVAGSALVIYFMRGKGRSLLWTAFCVAYLFCAYPAVSAWKHGQPVWLALAFYLFYLFGVEKQNSFCQGLAIAASTFKPQYGIILGLHALCARRWRAVAWAALGVAVTVLISIATVGWDNVRHYPHILHDAEISNSYTGIFPEFMICVRALLGRYLTPAQALDASSALWMFTVLIDCLLFVGAQKRSLSCRRWAFAVAICAGLVFSPHAHVHDILLLAAAFAVTRPGFDAEKLSAAGAILERLWLVLLLLYVPLSWPMHSAVMIAQFQKIPFLIANCLLLAIAVAILLVQWKACDTKYDAAHNSDKRPSPNVAA